MSDAAESILAAAINLSEEEREALTIKLLNMLPTSNGGDMSEEEFAAELDRRKAEMEQGVDEGISWAELKNMD